MLLGMLVMKSMTRYYSPSSPILVLTSHPRHLFMRR